MVEWRYTRVVPYVPNMGTKWRRVASFTTLPLYPLISWYQLYRRLDGAKSRSEPCAEEKGLYRSCCSNFGISLVTTSTELPTLPDSVTLTGTSPESSFCLSPLLCPTQPLKTQGTTHFYLVLDLQIVWSYTSTTPMLHHRVVKDDIAFLLLTFDLHFFRWHDIIVTRSFQWVTIGWCRNPATLNCRHVWTLHRGQGPRRAANK